MKDGNDNTGDNVEGNVPLSLTENLFFDFMLQGLGINRREKISTVPDVIDSRGLKYSLPEGKMTYNPEGWESFLKEVTFFNLPAVATQEKIKILAAFESWNAQRFVDAIRSGSSTWDKLIEEEPGIFKHPIVQKALAHDVAFKNVVIAQKKSTKAPFRAELLQLYGWACYYRAINNDYSLTDACIEAVEEHPDLVPQSWNDGLGKGDPDFHLGKRLRKEVYRLEANFPKYSQKQLRKKKS